MSYNEWSSLKEIKDKNNPFSHLYELESGEQFYVEPAFYTQLINFKEMYSVDEYNKILDKMIELVKERKRIVFTYDFEHPLTNNDDFIYLEFKDVTDLLRIYIEDKSRGSDYGD